MKGAGISRHYWSQLSCVYKKYCKLFDPTILCLHIYPKEVFGQVHKGVRFEVILSQSFLSY